MHANASSYDVAIVGGGFAGSTLAAALAARGYKIALCDPHAPHPRDFRAEKLAPDQMDALARLGLAQTVLRVATPLETLTIARRGRVVDIRPTREWGFDYAALVEAIRAEIPASAWLRSRVEAVTADGDEQIVALAGAKCFRARLVVLATGLALSLRKSLGLDRVTVRENHSLAIGFDLDADARAADVSLTYHGEQVAERIGYLTLFPIGTRVRANLFVYRTAQEAWSRAFQADPENRLRALMPGLAGMLPAFRVAGAPVLRPIHLYGPPTGDRAGVVLIGDAYSTTCPAGGGGLAKALTDVERLLTFVPGWIARTDGVSAADVAAWRNDPVKRISEANAARTAEVSRAMAIDPGLYWEARRRRNFYGLRAQSWLRGWRRAAPGRKIAGMM